MENWLAVYQSRKQRFQVDKPDNPLTRKIKPFILAAGLRSLRLYTLVKYDSMSQDFERDEFTFHKRRFMIFFFCHVPKERGVYNHFILIQILMSPGTFVLTFVSLISLSSSTSGPCTRVNLIKHSSLI